MRPQEAEKVAASQTSLTALGLFQANQGEIARLCARLCELVPAGASLLLTIDASGTPKLVTGDGVPLGRHVEVIQVVRPVCFMQQHFELQRRGADQSGEKTS